MSNGSSSMATACATSLALMDAGVPVSSPIGGISGKSEDGDGVGGHGISFFTECVCFCFVSEGVGRSITIGNREWRIYDTAV